MSASFVVDAELRTDMGKGASRRLRHEEKFPAVVYGAGKEPEYVTLDLKKMLHNLENEAFYSHILTLKTGKNEQQVILKDMQRHPAKPIIMHIDFLRVSAKDKLHIHIPLHFLNEEKSPGAKAGGLITHNMVEVEISCYPKDLPEFLEVDLSTLELDHSLHMSDIKTPAGVEIVELSHGEAHDQPIAACHMARGSKSDEAEDAAEGGAEPAAE